MKPNTINRPDFRFSLLAPEIPVLRGFFDGNLARVGLRINLAAKGLKIRILRTFAGLRGCRCAFGGACVLQFYCSCGVILLQSSYTTPAGSGGRGQAVRAPCW
jgi:hypothetical protein